MIIGYLRRAQQIAKQGIIDCLPFLQPGISEKELAVLINEQMRKLGSDGCWYPNQNGLPLVRFEVNQQIGRTYYCGRSFPPSADTKFAGKQLVYIAAHPTYKKHWGDYSILRPYH